VDEALQFLEQYGALILFLVVFAKEVGLPLPATPLLIAAGALAGTGQLNVWVLIGLSAVAALLGDWLWYLLGRRYGRRILTLLCRIALEPDSCVRRTENVFTKYGARSLVAAKFLPGLHTIAPPLAGIVGLSVALFVFYDGLGALIWAGAGVGAGYYFSGQLEQAMSYTAAVTPALGMALIGILAGYIIYKAFHRRLLRRVPRMTVGELITKLNAGEKMVLIDLRPPQTVAADPSIPGARAMSLEELARRHHELPRDREIVFYCGCPEDAASVQATLILRKKGFEHVRPLSGGIEAWQTHNYPLQQHGEQVA
jgi:membrane protein DedA with SNARE-associated domain/rhodanese-related sulfurtransferase